MNRSFPTHSGKRYVNLDEQKFAEIIYQNDFGSLEHRISQALQEACGWC